MIGTDLQLVGGNGGPRLVSSPTPRPFSSCLWPVITFYRVTSVTMT